MCKVISILRNTNIYITVPYAQRPKVRDCVASPPRKLHHSFIITCFLAFIPDIHTAQSQKLPCLSFIINLAESQPSLPSVHVSSNDQLNPHIQLSHPQSSEPQSTPQTLAGHRHLISSARTANPRSAPQQTNTPRPHLHQIYPRPQLSPRTSTSHQEGIHQTPPQRPLRHHPIPSSDSTPHPTPRFPWDPHPVQSRLDAPTWPSSWRA
jgi:hypothetical protein